MKVFDKIKDLFTDEEEEIIDTPVKKEVIQVEIPAPKVQPKVEKEEEEEPKKMQDTNVFFDELDFDDIKSSDATLDDLYRNVPAYKEEKKEIYKEAYAPKKVETKKHFEPTPIISPVYGVLDKNYKKDDIVDRSERPVAHKDMTVDDVRNKAYGTLEDELENTLFGRTAILFQEKEAKKEEYNELEEDLDKAAAAIDLLTEEPPKHVKKVEVEEPVKEKEVVYDETDDLVGEALKNDVVEKKEEALSENELFNLIDDIYGEGEK